MTTARWRAGGCADGGGLFDEEIDQPLATGQQRGGLLEQQALVGAATTFGHEQEFVTVLAVGGDLDLGGKVRAGVVLLDHPGRGHLGVPEIERRVGVVDAAREVLGVMAVGERETATLGVDDRGSGVLAHRQDTRGGDVRIVRSSSVATKRSLADACGSSRIAATCSR